MKKQIHFDFKKYFARLKKQPAISLAQVNEGLKRTPKLDKV
jgi:hypothetical protein